mmetsp:Transcript_10398/g.16978  ORF Transcript_10398/g.16978 Transcript_10398/m.16978 type:complete len:451 (+) Transcript_10398:104-1456(+)|eukprot:CAMPEP_0184657908 /NCGR_PEP_ID=MMETSP0308-20130426/22633_1 /TAXON_ID=38269 /ORGANISM="Gloeochaete witrockiana, Strain SAG 46.84" /LENGTH=450 /DNA_ID=CAMNT_0027096353 /DNA_START=55 /DNA_END=1407 /DNA_ORIENTATION=+
MSSAFVVGGISAALSVNSAALGTPATCERSQAKRAGKLSFSKSEGVAAGIENKGTFVAPLKAKTSKKVAVTFEINNQEKKYGDGWGDALAYDSSAGNDQLDIRRGRGMVDRVFQGKGVGSGSTHVVIQDSIEYYTTNTRKLNNIVGDYYICPAFMDKLVTHITKNFLSLPKVKVPLILGIWGGKGNGKSFQCELVFKAMGIEPILMSSGELEDASAGEPAKLIRQRYREAADIIKKGKMCVLMINDLDAGAGRFGGNVQYTVNNQMVNATLMNIADNPTNVQMPGMYNMEEIPRVPIIVTGNDFATLYAPLIRDGRMEKFFWAPTREDRVGICHGIFKEDGITEAEIAQLVDTFPTQSIDFFGAIRSRVYDDEVRRFVSEIGIENIAARLVNSKEKAPEFQKPALTIDVLIEYGHKLQTEQQLVQTVKLAEEYVANIIPDSPSDNGAYDY